MKTSVLVSIALALIGAIAFVVVQQKDASALNVNDVGGDPSSYSGTITIAGIMGGVSNQDPSIFGIMDLKELKCTTPNCNKLLIPVKYQGKVPSLGDEVRVTGSFMKVGESLLFSAQNVKVLRNHKIGG